MLLQDAGRDSAPFLVGCASDVETLLFHRRPVMPLNC